MARKLTEEELKEILGAEFLKFLIGLIDDCAEKTRGTFKDYLKKPYNPTVGAWMTRHLVREGFKDADNVQFTAHEHGFVLQRPRNLGIWFEFEGIHGRCYKAPKDKMPMKGKNDAKHKDEFMSNRPPEQSGIFGKEWVANVVILWSFDASGELVQLRAVIGDGWDDEGKLQSALDFELPTSIAEIGLDGFTPAEEETPPLFTKPAKPTEKTKETPKETPSGE